MLFGSVLVNYMYVNISNNRGDNGGDNDDDDD